MKALFLRDVRRLAALAAALLAAVLIFAWAMIGRRTGWTRLDALEAGLAVAACLLGVATVAPDTDSGAIAFLARLPIRESRALAAKVAAALLMLALLVAAATTIIMTVPTGTIPGRFGELLEVVAVAFAAGLLASVAVRRALPAVVVAPALVAVAIWAFGLPTALVLGINHLDGDALACILAGAFTAVAFLAYARGDRHRDSRRPAFLAFGAVAFLDLLAFSGMALAHGWSVHEAPRWMHVLSDHPVESRDGRRFALSLGGTHWGAWERRLAVAERSDRSVWLAPLRGAVPLSFSPSGERLLVSSDEGRGGWLLDVPSRTFSTLAPAWVDAYDGFGGTATIWRGERPFFVRVGETRIDVRAAGGAVAATVSFTAVKLAGTIGEKIAALANDGLFFLDPFAGTSENVLPVDRAAGLEACEAAVSPDGRRAVLVVANESECRGYVADLAARGAPRAIEGDVSRLINRLRDNSFSPDGTRLAIDCDDAALVLDLVAATLVEHPQERNYGAASPCWSPDSRLLALPWGEIVEPATGISREARVGICAFLDSKSAVGSGAPLTFVDVATGRAVARPLEER